MWKKVKATGVDQIGTIDRWIVQLRNIPVGHLSYKRPAPGSQPWKWSADNVPGASGRAWTEEAAINMIKQAVLDDYPRPA
ncbi:hypothetical protein [Paracoccus aminophilus]|uniref:hypothetical protein n=1 Tax=Paracoccus aminophilus TaxID=34003 RepID=UPI0011DDF4A5|nr:hypothetical protein [Paracoccus aminophilus]